MADALVLRQTMHETAKHHRAQVRTSRPLPTPIIIRHLPPSFGPPISSISRDRARIPVDADDGRSEFDVDDRLALHTQFQWCIASGARRLCRVTTTFFPPAAARSISTHTRPGPPPGAGRLQDDALEIPRGSGTLHRHLHALGVDLDHDALRDHARVDVELDDDLLLGLRPAVRVRAPAALLGGEVLHPARTVGAEGAAPAQTRHVHRGPAAHLRRLLRVCAANVSAFFVLGVRPASSSASASAVVAEAGAGRGDEPRKVPSRERR